MNNDVSIFMKKEEKALSNELLGKALTNGNEWAWKLEDIPDVVKECQILKYAILGGQIQFILPDSACEIPELNTDPKDKTQKERWADYVVRSQTEFLELFYRLVKTIDAEKEDPGLPFIKRKTEFLERYRKQLEKDTNSIINYSEFSFLDSKKELGGNILNYMYFVIYPVTEKRYKKEHLDDLFICNHPSSRRGSSEKPYTFSSSKLKHQAIYCRGWKIREMAKMFLSNNTPRLPY